MKTLFGAGIWNFVETSGSEEDTYQQEVEASYLSEHDFRELATS